MSPTISPAAVHSRRSGKAVCLLDPSLAGRVFLDP